MGFHCELRALSLLFQLYLLLFNLLANFDGKAFLLYV